MLSGSAWRNLSTHGYAGTSWQMGLGMFRIPCLDGRHMPRQTTGKGSSQEHDMHTGGLGNHLALIALSHASLALADQAIPVGHAAIVLSQWLHLMARLALLQNIKGACMHMGLTFIHPFIDSYTEQTKSVSCSRARFTLAKRAEQQTCVHAAGVCKLMLMLPQMLPSQALKL